MNNETQHAVAEFIVVGSGAGGGTVAARLAESGHSVLLLEAGGDPRDVQNDISSPSSGLPNDYDVPAFNAYASENTGMAWNFFVRHYASDDRQKRDPNYVETHNGKRVDGVLYPRSAALGGCTAHNAMIFVYPHNSDWDEIAELTGDSSWKAEHMRTYFERLENCRHRGLHRLLNRFGFNPTRHGWNGWLSAERAIPPSAIFDWTLVRTILISAWQAFIHAGNRRDHLRWLWKGAFDPNDWRLVKESAGGARYLPLTTSNHARTGTRERILDVHHQSPQLLTIELNALATKIVFDDANRAIGVEYIKGHHLYGASANPSSQYGQTQRAYASREVILSGGTFNTPQILMLSGIGPAEELAAHDIPVRVDLPGVGRNLQDRYEVPVVNRMKFKQWRIFRGARFSSDDPLFQQWRKARQGPYITNGGVLAAFRRSFPGKATPDIFCLAVLGLFRGYKPGYSALFAENLNYLTWVVLKAHTNNRAGRVTLRSASPFDPPLINFHYFDEGNDQKEEDLAAVVEGIRFTRKITQYFKNAGEIEAEEMPGDALQSDDDLRTFVRDHAWGHHASSTCAIGPRDQLGVLTSDFRVHGTQGLRVVDASIFPRIPGFFIASAIFMAAEKAADVILRENQST
ncbi:MAG: GMC family oxidoreductase N-terminal domain-containing protein [Acidobacteria bacterium]|nr:GMC family oxidoreductase N-terminal domain-containing protein [Acidobacteriota bacterium]